MLLKIPFYDMFERLMNKDSGNALIHRNDYEDYDALELKERGLTPYY